MGIYASNADGLEDVLCLMEHPLESFKAYRLSTRIWLGGFLALYLPLALIVAFIFEILFRMPFKLAFASRDRAVATTDENYWYDFTYASPGRKLLMVHLQDEISAVGLDGTTESACEKGSRARRTSAWTKMTVTWMWTKNIYVPPLAIPPRSLGQERALQIRRQDSMLEIREGERLPHIRHLTSMDEDLVDHTLSRAGRCTSIAEEVDDVVFWRALLMNSANVTATVTSLILPFAHALRPRNHYLHRLAVIFLAFGPLFVILTISYEGLFYFAIAVTLVSWVRLEHRIHQRFNSDSRAASNDQAAAKSTSGALGNGRKSTANGHAPNANGAVKKQDVTTPLALAADAAKQREEAVKSGDYRSLTLSDARICLFFLFLLQSAFFSTGNIASISSFSLDAVYRLLPVFDPFSQGALLLLKLLAPFALVSANLGILTKRLRLRGGGLFAIVMGIGDYLTLRFFWEVRDEGSWLEIGESISMFVIASVLCVFVAGLEGLSGVLVKGVEFENGQKVLEKLTTSNGSKKAKGANGTLNGKPPGVVKDGT
ncbi:Putative GPI ethanolamine phosphate transferase 1 [Septoria linicola]|uniref:GPI ethanolamine phosphate transferase 1 n=1 Tax=Septoria linicola TaxID=215465 RepID=A0A9Q9AYC3_9PEZI|nr:Putative GPI ethanolamine phosphate transferase 1 [Septoria linicola]